MALRLGLLISGGGTTMVNLAQAIATSELDAEIACVVSSSAKAAGNQRALELGLDLTVIRKTSRISDFDYSSAINRQLVERAVDLVVMGGFLKRYLPGKNFENRCLNIHPSLIPAFCGQGFYGMRVHQAVWERGCKVSGCTVHLVNDEYDAGPIVLQKTVEIDADDDAQTIQRKVFALECEAYPEAIRLFGEQRLIIEGGRVRIRPS